MSDERDLSEQDLREYRDHLLGSHEVARLRLQNELRLLGREAARHPPFTWIVALADWIVDRLARKDRPMSDERSEGAEPDAMAWAQANIWGQLPGGPYIGSLDSEGLILVHSADQERRRVRTGVFAGNSRTIGLPPGWICDHSRWAWWVIGRNEEDRTATLGLFVYTEHPATENYKWREVGDGVPFYAHGETFGEIPGSWRQETMICATDSLGGLIDPPDRIMPEDLVPR